MEDKRIIELFFARSEKAIEEAQNKYGRYCYTVAYSILASKEDSEEIVNDTYLRAWNSIPPQKPTKLGAFLATVARNLALDRYESHRKHRNNTVCEGALEELEECLPTGEGVSVTDELVLKAAINGFLASLSEKNRVIFMRRYWYMMPVSQIADLCGVSEENVKTSLHRTRKRFKEYLEKEGIVI